jgi:hypothetical protein
MISIKEQLLEEFDKLTPYPEDCGDNYCEQKEWLKKNNHLYDNEVYNEPMYDLSEDKIKAFLLQAIDRAIKETIKENELVDLTGKSGDTIYYNDYLSSKRYTWKCIKIDNL